MKKIGYLILSLFLLLSAVSIALRTSWGIKTVTSFLLQHLKRGDLGITLGKIEGALPSTLKISEIQIEQEGFFLDAKDVTLQLSLFKLLKKEIGFSLFSAQSLEIEEQGNYETKPTLPFSLSISHFSIDSLKVGRFSLTHTSGSFYWGKTARLHLKSQEISLDGSLKNEILKLKLQGQYPNPLPSWHTNLSYTLFAKGKWKDWQEDLKNIEGTLLATLTFEDLPIQPIQIASSFFKTKENQWSLPDLNMENEWFASKSSALLSSDGHLDECQFIAHAKQKIPFLGQTIQPKVKGSCKAALQNLNVESEWEVPSFGPLHATQARVHFTSSEEGVEGSLFANGQLFSEEIKVQSPFLKRKNEPLFFSSYEIEAPSLHATGALLFETALFTGHTDILRCNLAFFPSFHLLGDASGKIVWDHLAEVQTAFCDLHLQNVYWKNVFLEEGSARIDLLDPFQTPHGSFDLSAEKSSWGPLFLDHFHIKAPFFKQNTPFALEVEGNYRAPFSLEMQGIQNWDGETLFLQMDTLEGTCNNQSFALNAPTSFTYGKNLLKISDFTLSLEEGGFLKGSTDWSREKKALTLQARQLPLELLPLDPFEVSLEGLLDLDFEWEKNFSLQLTDLRVLSSSHSFDASGYFSGQMEKNRIVIEGDLLENSHPALSLSLNFPSDFSQKQPIFGHITFDGHIENLLNLFDLKSHKIEGKTKADLKLSGSFEKPKCEGFLDIEEGVYQNDDTGTYLTDLSATFSAIGPEVILTKLSAKDFQHKGSFAAKGKVKLRPKKHFPFHFNASFERLNLVQFYLIQAEASGTVSVKGTTEEGFMSGELEILEADLTIPDKIPRSLPDLNVVYRGPSPSAFKAPSHPPYPLSLDLKISAPNGVFISGRGLDSEWRGNFHLTGTLQALQTRGNIDLIEGKFHLSNKTFELISGKLLFTGKENEMPLIDIEGKTKVKEIAIFAKLKGPLNHPQLSLSSSPLLPLSSVLAYLLFGEDVSDINSFQALELINSLTDIAGTSPGVLEKSRQALGIDRIRLVSISSQDEEEAMAVQVGKYVADGVLVTLSQGASDASANIGVEVELSHGFSFQIETQQIQEQGKFSLKWSWNY